MTCLVDFSDELFQNWGSQVAEVGVCGKCTANLKSRQADAVLAFLSVRREETLTFESLKERVEASFRPAEQTVQLAEAHRRTRLRQREQYVQSALGTPARAHLRTVASGQHDRRLPNLAQPRSQPPLQSVHVFSTPPLSAKNDRS